MNAKSMMTLTLDDELAEAWNTLWKIEQKPFETFLKDMLLRETLKYARPEISESVKRLTGTLNTTFDYKQLREQMLDERLKDYETLY